MSNRLRSAALIALVAGFSVGCKTYNAVIHKGPSKDVPKSWDFDEPVRADVFNSKIVNLSTVCKGGDWETAKVYHQWFFGWKVAVKCKG